VIAHEAEGVDLRLQAGYRADALFSWEGVTDSLEELYARASSVKTRNHREKLAAVQE